MAHLHSFKTMRSSFFHLPPLLRTVAFAHTTSTTRPFSCTPRKDMDPVSVMTAGPDFVMESLHHLGLSWAAVIPCTTILLRGVVSYYLFTLPQRRKDREEAAIRPLIHAYTLSHREQPSEKEKERKAYWDAGEAGLRAYRRSWQFRANLRGWWTLGHLTGVSRWRNVGSKVANFGILVAAVEALRMKCGSGEGLLSLVYAPFKPIWDGISGALAAPLVGLRQKSGELLGQNGGQATLGGASAPEIGGIQAAIATQTAAEVTQASSATSIYQALPDTTSLHTIDPTLQTEGLLFCPDLTLADPTGILPFAMFSTMAISAFLSPRPPNSFIRRGTWIGAIREKWRTLPFGQRLSIAIAGYFWIVARSLPAGMVLYILTNVSIGFVQRVWLDVKHPTLKAIKHCVRPVRQKRKRLW